MRECWDKYFIFETSSLAWIPIICCYYTIIILANSFLCTQQLISACWPLKYPLKQTETWDESKMASWQKNHSSCFQLSWVHRVQVSRIRKQSHTTVLALAWDIMKYSTIIPLSQLTDWAFSQSDSQVVGFFPCSCIRLDLSLYVCFSAWGDGGLDASLLWLQMKVIIEKNHTVLLYKSILYQFCFLKHPKEQTCLFRLMSKLLLNKKIEQSKL